MNLLYKIVSSRDDLSEEYLLITKLLPKKKSPVKEKITDNLLNNGIRTRIRI